MPVALYRDEAVVIRTQKLGEADRIVTLFSRQRGRIRAVAKGVRRTKSKFGARLEPASYVDIQLYTGKTFDVVTQVEAIENYGDAISGDYQRWTIASAILETAERFTNKYSDSLYRKIRNVPYRTILQSFVKYRIGVHPILSYQTQTKLFVNQNLSRIKPSIHYKKNEITQN